MNDLPLQQSPSDRFYRDISVNYWEKPSEGRERKSRKGQANVFPFSRFFFPSPTGGSPIGFSIPKSRPKISGNPVIPRVIFGIPSPAHTRPDFALKSRIPSLKGNPASRKTYWRPSYRSRYAHAPTILPPHTLWAHLQGQRSQSTKGCRWVLGFMGKKKHRKYRVFY